MKAFWVLTKLQLLQAYSLNPLIQGKKWGKLLGFGVLGLYLIGIFAFVVYFFAEGIVRAFAALGALEAFPPLIAALVCVSTWYFPFIVRPPCCFPRASWKLRWPCRCGCPPSSLRA